MSGPHFRDYHLLLDEHASQIFAMTDEIAEIASSKVVFSICIATKRHKKAQEKQSKYLGFLCFFVALPSFEAKPLVASPRLDPRLLANT